MKKMNFDDNTYYAEEYNADDPKYTSDNAPNIPTITSNYNTIAHYLSLCGMIGGELFSMSKSILNFINGPSKSILKDGGETNNITRDSHCIMSELQLHYEDLKETKTILMAIEELLGMEK